MSGTESGPIRSTTMDKRMTFLIFNAIERMTVEAVEADEMEIAAELVDSLFTLQGQLPQWTEEYHDVDGGGFTATMIAGAIREVREWGVENGHPVTDWFDDTVEDPL